MSSRTKDEGPPPSPPRRPSRSAPSLRLLLVEDSPVIRERLGEVISEIAGVDLAGEADSLAAARASISSSHFDAVILDIGLPDGNGLDILPDLDGKSPRPVVLVLTNHAGDGYRRRALAAGATFFFDKSVELDGLVDTLSGLTAAETLPDPAGTARDGRLAS